MRFADSERSEAERAQHSLQERESRLKPAEPLLSVSTSEFLRPTLPRFWCYQIEVEVDALQLTSLYDWYGGDFEPVK